jgi:hypothetical protein
MKLKKILTGHFLVLVLALPNAALAEDFTFNLQVNLSELHSDVAKVRIYCAASISPGGGIIGEGDLEIDVPANGAINNNVQIKFNAGAGRNLSDAKVYRCATYLFKQGTNTQTVPRDSTHFQCQNSENDWHCGKEGTTFDMGFFGSYPVAQ